MTIKINEILDLNYYGDDLELYVDVTVDTDILEMENFKKEDFDDSFAEVTVKLSDCSIEI